MKITLTQAQMLALWRQAQGLQPTAAAVTVEQWDSIDIETQLAIRMRQWYLRLLDSADERLLSPTDISAQLTLTRLSEGTYAATLPFGCRRLLRLQIEDAGGRSLVIPQPIEYDIRHDTRYRRRRANRYAAEAYIPPRARVCGPRLVVMCDHGAAGAEALPTILAADAIIDPGEDTYVLDEAALATIPGDVDLSTFV